MPGRMALNPRTAERPELLGEALGHADDRPFGGGIGQPVCVAEAPCHRRDVHDRSLFRLLEHRHGAPRAVEVAVEIDVDRAPPLPRIDILHFARGTGDAGVVDQHVEPAEPSLHIVEQAVDRGFVGDVGLLGDDARLFGAAFFDRFPRGNIADVDAGVVGGKGLGNGAPDARRSGGDEDAQARLHAPACRIAHGLAPSLAAFPRFGVIPEVDIGRGGVLASPVFTTTWMLLNACTHHRRRRHDRPQATERLAREGKLAGRQITAPDAHRRIAPEKPAGFGGEVALATADISDPGRSPRTSPRVPTSSSTWPRSFPARPRRISTRATASISTARATSSRRSVMRARDGLSAAPGVHLVGRGLRRAVSRRDRRRVLLHAADQLRHAEGDRRAAARRLFAPRLSRRHRHPPADHLHPARASPTRRPRASSPTSCASRSSGQEAVLPVAETCGTGREPARRRRLSRPRGGAGSRPLGRAARPHHAGPLGDRRRTDRGAAPGRPATRRSKLIRREPDTVIASGWWRDGRAFDAAAGAGARFPGRRQLRRHHPHHIEDELGGRVPVLQ